MILLSLVHSIMHATMINWIQYMGDMGVISNISGKYPILGDLKKCCDLWTPYMTPYSIQPPYKSLSYLWDIPLFMRRWEIRFNVRVMWLKCANYVKNSRFFVIFDDFLDIWSQITSPILHQEPNEWLFYLRDIPFCIFQGEIRFIVRVICLLFQKCVKKIAHFWWFLRFLWHRGP